MNRADGLSVDCIIWSERTYCDAKLKRLEAGTFQLPAVTGDTQSVTLSDTQLAMILRGVDLSSVRQRKRYRRNA